MAGIFVRPSLTIQLNSEVFPFGTRYFEASGYFNEPTIWVIFHELIHFWQAISMNFVTNVAMSEWNRMLYFEKYDRIPNFEDDYVMMHRNHPEYKYRPNDLLECLAQYWDIQVLGAERVKLWRQNGVKSTKIGDLKLQENLDNPVAFEAGSLFDEVMMNEPRYSRPYKDLYRFTNSFFAFITFPIITYFSFQSRDPVKLYMETIISLRDKITSIFESDIATIQQDVYFPFIYKHMKEISSQFGIEFAEPRSTIKTIASNHHNAKMNPLLIHYGRYLKKLDDGAAIYNVDLNRHFALPGNLKYRGQLISGPMPPLVKFENGSWALQKLMRRIFVREVGDEEIWDQLAAISQSIHDRWRKYRIAVATK